MGKEHIWRTAAVNSIALEELKRLGEVFSRPPSIPAVVLKGGALAFTLYPDRSLRPINDLDLLVPEERLEEAAARIQALGYKEVSPIAAPGRRKSMPFHCIFAKESVPIALELHWNLLAGGHSRYAPDMAWFWAHTEPLPLPFPSPFLMLDPTGHLLYLATHAMLEHGEGELDPKWLYDIHLLVEREGERINWEELATKAIAFRWAVAVARTFERCSQLFGTSFPEGTIQTLKNEKDKSMLKLLERKTFARRKSEKAWKMLWILDWHGKLSFMRSLLFPSPAFVRWCYRPKLLWFWYLCNWFHIAWEGGRLLVQMGRQKFLALPVWPFSPQRSKSW